MSKYPIWWDTTITLYNKYENKQTNLVTWYRTVIHNCFYKNVGNKITIGDTVLETNDTIIRIPKDINFLERYEWVAIPNDEMGNYFTLGNGDIIVKGEVDDIINEYLSGHRSNDLINKYKEMQGCVEIQEVGINVGRGRCNEHYLVKGV